MYNDDFDFYPEHPPPRNMRFEKPMHGPPGRGHPGPHHMRHPGPMRRRGPPPDMPPNFRGPREPMYDDFPPHNMGGPPMGMGRGPHFGGNNPRFGGNSPQHMQQHNMGPPRNQHGPNMGPPGPGNGPPFHQKGPRHGPPIMPFPPPGFGGPNGGPNEGPPQHMQQHQQHMHQQQQQQNSGPPPNPADNLDFWVETIQPDTGKAYYYHAKTRESSWTKPPNAKVISQEEVEKMAAAATTGANNESGGGAPNDKPPLQPFPGMNPMACPMPAPMMAPPAFGMGPPPPFAMPPPGLMFPFGIPPPAFGPPIPQVPPDVAAQNAAMPGIMKSAEGDDKDPWDEYTTPEGKVYYAHRITKETCWEKPTKKPEETSTDNGSTQESDSVKISEADTTNSVMEVEESSDSQSDVKNTEQPPDPEKMQQDMIPDDKKPDYESGTAMYDQIENNVGQMSPVVKLEEQEKMEKEEEENKPTEEEKKLPIDKSRPVSSTPIPKSHWFVVWTGDQRAFFYSHVMKTSVWQRPDELKGRTDVDKLLEEPPTACDSQTEVKTEATETGEKQKSENDSGPETKRVKREEGTDAKTAAKTSITPGKESAIEAELRAAKERATISLDVRMKQFIELLVEKDVSAFSTWEKELHKIVFDPRYLLLTSKERKSCFERYVRDRAEEERSEKRKRAKERRDDFKKLLEDASLTSKSTFSDFAQRYAKDERFKSIEKLRERESMFNDFVDNLRRKERDERSTMKEKSKKEFLELLKENQETFDKNKRWSDVKKSLSDDHRYKAVDSSSLREEWFKEYMRSLHDAEDDSVKEREKQERVEASIREREKEVQRTLSTHLRERDKERELHKHDEAVQHFKALLTDLVRSPDVTWHELKRILRKDHRSDLMGSLSREERERIFDEHISLLNRKKKEKFRELLEETQEITLTSGWKEVKKLIKDDPRCSKFSSSDRKCEKEFKEYLKDKMVAAKADFRELLKETKIITYKSRKLIEDTDHLHDIEKVLQNDKRYLVLQCIEDERRTLLMSYIDTLERKGPPPPPTASEPSRRSTK